MLSLVILMLSVISAEIIITSQPEAEYYSGQNLKVPIKVISATDINDFLNVQLICGSSTGFSEEKFVSLKAGEEEQVTTTIPLVTKFVGNNVGTCKVKVALGEDFIISNNFAIKNQLTVSLINVSDKTEYSPEETITIIGVASKSNLEEVNGILDMVATSSEGKIEAKETVTNGNFVVKFQVPRTTKYGKYSATITITEKDYLGEITNTGVAEYSFNIKQVAKNLEIITSADEVKPGESISIKPIMHDQTGENIPMDVTITIKDASNNLIFQKDIPTGEDYSYQVNSTQVPATWKIESSKENLNVAKKIIIQENKELKTEVVNSTLIVRNLGNVVFNDTIKVKIGEVTKEILVSLGLGQEELYSLSAPDGVYDVEVDTGIGQNKSQVVSGVMLTGNAIDIKKASDGVISFIASPIVWIFLILVVGVFAYITYIRLHKKGSSGHIYRRKNDDYGGDYKTMSAPIVRDRTVTAPSQTATISPSIKGDEQEATVVCLKVKNFAKEIDHGESNAKEVLQNLTEFADRVRASTHENNGTFLFIFAPVKTKTFDNEKAAMDLAKKIKDTLDHHNRYFKQRIDYGLAINKGTIVAKPEGRNSLQFSSLGTFANVARRIAGISNGEILLGESVKDKLMKDVAMEKHSSEGLNYYSTGEVKHVSESRERVNEIYRKMQN